MAKKVKKPKSSRIRSFLERAKNFLMEQASDDLFDHFCHRVKYFCVFLAFYVYPMTVSEIKSLIWPAEPVFKTPWPLPVFFLLALPVYYQLILYCYTLMNKERFQCGVAYLLRQHQMIYLRKLAGSFKVMQRGMKGPARKKFAKDSKETITEYKKSLEDTFYHLKKSDEPYVENQVFKTMDLLEFMADFEAEVDNLSTKCEEQQPVFETGPLEACLRRKL